MVFVLDVEKGTSSTPSAGSSRGRGGSVDLQKAFDCVPQEVLRGVLRDYRVSCLLMHAVRFLYDQSQSLACIAGSKSD